MLLDYDIVTERKAEAGSLTCGLCREERIEHFVLHFRRDANAIVSNSNLDLAAEARCYCGKFRLVICLILVSLAFSSGIEAIRN